MAWDVSDHESCHIKQKVVSLLLIIPFDTTMFWRAFKFLNNEFFEV